jgi:PRTRC genetic system protein C
MARIFIIDGRENLDPDPALTVDQVKAIFAGFMPEVATADMTTTKRGDDEVIEFKRKVGTKG